jgi:putative SOS response-associated peptidase YedK
MCNRVNLRTSPHELNRLLESLGLTLADFAPRYNVAPTEALLIIRKRQDAYECCTAQWGLRSPLVTFDPRRPAHFNARSETAHTKATFRDAFNLRRCLIPVAGFYEWEHVGKRKQPFHVTMKSGALFTLAGLWEDNGDTPSCTILTTAANDLIRPLHDRMPVIVAPRNFVRWLDTKNDRAAVADILAPYPAELMRAVPVSTYVNKAGNEGPECHAPAEPEEQTLFDLG